MATFGNHSANAVEVSLSGPANRLVFNLSGLDALGELQIEQSQTPEPGTISVLGIGLLALARTHRRRRS